MVLTLYARHTALATEYCVALEAFTLRMRAVWLAYRMVIVFLCLSLFVFLDVDEPM